MGVYLLTAYFLTFLGWVSCQCPSNAIYYKSVNSCYYINDDTRLKWDEWRNKCENMGGNLLIINSHKEEDAVHWSLRQRLNRNNTRSDIRTRWWVGLRRIDNQWQWVDGQAADIDTLIWHASQPNIKQDGTVCVEFFTVLLNDVNCTQKRGGICELPPTGEMNMDDNPLSQEEQWKRQRGYIFLGIISGIALLAVVAIIAVICLSVRVRRLRRTYQQTEGHQAVSQQPSLVSEMNTAQERAPQTLPRQDHNRYLTPAHSYAEPTPEQHPGYEKLNHFSPRYLDLRQ